MGYKAIFFDLDGTLLPMDQDAFTNGYFKELCAAVCPLGIDPKTMVDVVWAATGSMVKNDGARTNEAVFWDRFAALTQMDNVNAFRSACDRFYGNEFHRARVFTRPNPLAVEAVKLAREKGRQVVLATNPVFPLVGQASRLSWIGLAPADFTLVTSYESDRFSKPNPRYYEDICRRLELSPAECLMIGNDETEDMYAATAAGLSAYLVTDCRIPSEAHPWAGPAGTFPEMVEMLRNL